MQNGLVKVDSIEGQFLVALNRTEEGRHILETMGYFGKPLQKDDLGLNFTDSTYEPFRSKLQFKQKLNKDQILLVFTGLGTWAYTSVDAFIVNQEYSVLASFRDQFRNQAVTKIRYQSQMLKYCIEPMQLQP